MAVEPVNEQSPTGDFQSHSRDYSGFIKLFKWGAIISFVTAMVVMIIISN
ncbi:MAG: aa3-type cytochrome c oxidase subunit IV [Pseudomonadota bacterium]|nr:aa3-type cytochrome c oxidase subunit IV [Pseudomonadota bacterium]